MIKLKAYLIILILLLTLILGFTGCMSESGDSDSIIWGRSFSVGTGMPVANLRFSLDGINIFGVTDKTGYFVLDGVPEGNYTARFVRNGILLSTLPFSISNEQALNGETIQIQWPTPITGDGTFSGVVTNETSAPIEGVEILIARPDNNIQKTSTDEFGAYSFSGLPMDGQYMVLASMPGYESTAKPMTLSETQLDRVNFQLQPVSDPILPWGSVAGMVVDEHGVELSDVYVAIYPKNVVNPLNDVTGETLTDLSGSFMFSKIIEGPYVLWVGRSGDGVVVKDIFIDAGMGWEGKIVLNGSYSINP